MIPNIKIDTSLFYSFDNINKAIDSANTATTKSETALNNSQSTQAQLDQIVIQGDSSVEAAQARVDVDGTSYETLKERLDSGQLKQIDTKETIKFEANAPVPLHIPTYDGSNQSTHPKVLYFPNELWNYPYWMAYTPYPFSDDDYENPCIAASVDGITWVENPYRSNPLDQLTSQELSNLYHLSDTHLVWRADLGRLECWYRYNKNGVSEKIMRKYSTDGANWSAREVVYETDASYQVLSPAVIYEDAKYKMWFCKSGYAGVWYTETSDMITWSAEINIPIDFSGAQNTKYNYYMWHIDVVKHGGEYHIIGAAGDQNLPFENDRKEIVYGKSIDGLSFSVETLMIPNPPKSGRWDNRYLYRSSILFIDDTVKVYYAAYNQKGSWFIGLSEGDDPHTLAGTIPIDKDGHFMPSNGILLSETQKLFLESDEASFISHRAINLREKGLSEGRVVIGINSDGNTSFLLMNDGETSMVDMEAEGIISAYLRSTTAFIKNLYPSAGLDQIEAAAKIKITNENSTDAELHMVKAGVAGVRSVVNDPDTLEIRGDSNTYLGHLKINGLLMNDEVVTPAVEGALRYNDAVKKHQGYDGAAWHDLY